MKKKVIIISIIIIIIITTILTSVFIINKKNKQSSMENMASDIPYTPKLDTKLTTLNGSNTLNYINVVVNRYYNYIKESKKTEIINIIDKKYSNKIKLKQKKLNNYYINLKQIDRTQQEEYLSTNVVRLNIIDKQTKDIMEETLVVRLDFQNYTFSIIPDECLENKDNLVKGKNFQISTDLIEVNENNSLKDIEYGEYTLAELYYDKIKNLSLYNVEEAYSLLDENYKETYCNNVKKYKKIVSKIFDENSKVTHFKKRITSKGITTIECKDSKNNEFIIIFNDSILDFAFYIK